MGKVLISFLGTGHINKIDNIGENKPRGKYAKTNYRIQNTDYETSMVALAIKQHYMIDKCIFIGTMKSMWDELYYAFTSKEELSDEEMNIWSHLEKQQASANSKTPLNLIHKEDIETAIGNDSKIMPIKYGLNTDELRENGEIILDIEDFLKNGDELYIDITHSFRSLPMYIMNMLIYLRDISNKKVKISQVCYGMFEASNELKYTPVVDMSEILSINAWILGSYNFSQFGNAYKIAELVKSIDTSLSKRLEEFSDCKNLNHLIALRNQCQQLQAIKNNNLPIIAQKVITPVVNRFLKDMGPINNNSHASFQFNLAKWQRNHFNYAAAYLCLNEAILTRACELLNQDALDKDIRDSIKDIRGEYSEGLKGRNWYVQKHNRYEKRDRLTELQDNWLRTPKNKHNLEKRIDRICSDFDIDPHNENKRILIKKIIMDFIDLYNLVADNRNALAHSLTDSNGSTTNTPKNMITDLDKYIQKYIEICS